MLRYRGFGFYTEIADEKDRETANVENVRKIVFAADDTITHSLVILPESFEDKVQVR